jgi:hypothetical protein
MAEDFRRYKAGKVKLVVRSLRKTYSYRINNKRTAKIHQVNNLP